MFARESEREIERKRARGRESERESENDHVKTSSIAKVTARAMFFRTKLELGPSAVIDWTCLQ